MKTKHKLNSILIGLIGAFLYAGTVNAETRSCWPKTNSNDDIFGDSTFGWKCNAENETCNTSYGTLSKFYGQKKNIYITYNKSSPYPAGEISMFSGEHEGRQWLLTRIGDEEYVLNSDTSSKQNVSPQVLICKPSTSIKSNAENYYEYKTVHEGASQYTPGVPRRVRVLKTDKKTDGK